MVVTPHYQIFNNLNHQNSFNDLGYGFSPYLNAAQLKQLKDLHNKIEPYLTYQNDFAVSVLTQDIELREFIHNEIVKICQPSLNKIFKDYQIVIAHFFTKKSSENTFIHLHQDAMFTDQVISPGVGIWASLDDLTPQAGSFGFVNHSVYSFAPFQDETIPRVYDSVKETLLANSREFNVKAGQGIFFDNRLIHYTRPNVSGKVRVGVTIKVTHKDAELFTVRSSQNKTDFIEVYRHNEKFYLKENWFFNPNLPANKSAFFGFIPYKNQLHTEESINKILQKRPVNDFQKTSLKSLIVH